MAQRALADTSVFIGLEAARFDVGRFADFEWGISAITLGELRLGVLQAKGPEAASRRLSTYQLAQRFEALAVDEAVSEAWALLVSRLRLCLWLHPLPHRLVVYLNHLPCQK